ncbi:MAG: Na+/H+ antiporter NhaC family protein [Gemmatimonadales bacterium]
MTRTSLRAAVAALIGLAAAPSASAQDLEVASPHVILTNIPFALTITAPGRLDTVSVQVMDAAGRVMAEGVIAPFGELVLSGLSVSGRALLPLTVAAGDATSTVEAPVLPGWLSIVPPLIAIVLALIFREVVTSLLAGVFIGAMFVAGMNPLAGLMLTVDTFVREALGDPDHAAIIIFSLLLGGMVGIMSRMGGTRAVVEAVTPFATTRRRGLFATWAAGLAIFFDDYANTLIVGNTMRPLTDKLKISREKLAYIVDSTAAPVAVLVFVSTWVGFEIGLIGDALHQAAVQYPADPALQAELTGASPFSVYLHSVPFLFYPLLAVFTVAILTWTGRDFGPMLKAEQRALSGGGLFRPGAQLAADTGSELAEAPAGTPMRWWNGAIPVLTVVVVVVTGLLWTGMQALGEGDPATLSNILGSADPFKGLLWGSFAGCLVAVVLAVSQRIASLRDAVGAWVGGMRAMLLAMVILILAWSLGEVTVALNTAGWLTSMLSDSMPMRLLPVTTFVIAALISFATGTSWGTMAILFPLVVPLSVAMGGGVNFEGGEHYTVLLGAISSVMAGAIFGDHCSPISDTTVLSSMASGCDHVDHVRTQLPYALMVAGVGMLVGDIPTAYGLSPWISLPLGMVIIWSIIRVVGRKPEGQIA